MTWVGDVRERVCRRWKPGDEFTVAQVYEFAGELGQLHPANSFVDEKIRQTLQVLRDEGLIEFLDNQGTYRRVS